MRVVSIYFPGRPGLTALAILGSTLMYTGLIVGVLSLREVFRDGHLWWLPVSIGTVAALGFGLIRLAMRIWERSHPVATYTVDAETWARLQAMVAEQERGGAQEDR